jgi:hypothetical protein
MARSRKRHRCERQSYELHIGDEVKRYSLDDLNKQHWMLDLNLNEPR